MSYNITLNGEIPRDVLKSYAKYILPSIRDFIESEDGSKYIQKWLEKHPEYKDDFEP